MSHTFLNFLMYTTCPPITSPDVLSSQQMLMKCTGCDELYRRIIWQTRARTYLSRAKLFLEGILVSRSIIPLIPKLRPIWRWMWGFTHRPLYRQRKGHNNALNLRLGGLDVWRRQNFLPLPGIETQCSVPQSVACKSSSQLSVMLTWYQIRLKYRVIILNDTPKYQNSWNSF
jgi:hypothetical protein